MGKTRAHEPKENPFVGRVLPAGDTFRFMIKGTAQERSLTCPRVVISERHLSVEMNPLPPKRKKHGLPVKGDYIEVKTADDFQRFKETMPQGLARAVNLGMSGKADAQEGDALLRSLKATRKKVMELSTPDFFDVLMRESELSNPLFGFADGKLYLTHDDLRMIISVPLKGEASIVQEKGSKEKKLFTAEA